MNLEGGKSKNDMVTISFSDRRKKGKPSNTLSASENPAILFSYFKIKRV